MEMCIRDRVSEWLIKRVNTETMPAISFSWSRFTDRDYYMNLNDVMMIPNQFVEEGEEGSDAWKDMFPEYLWKQKEQVDAKGNIIAVDVYKRQDQRGFGIPRRPRVLRLH